MDGARTAADLVQVLRLPLARGHRAARRLREFGLELDELGRGPRLGSSAEVRYMVLPERPAGTEGLSEEELAALVTRDAMIGVATVNAPALAE